MLTHTGLDFCTFWGFSVKWYLSESITCYKCGQWYSYQVSTSIYSIYMYIVTVTIFSSIYIFYSTFKASTFISISISMIAAIIVNTAAFVLCGRISQDWNGMLICASWSNAIVPKYDVLKENILDSGNTIMKLSEIQPDLLQKKNSVSSYKVI